MEAMVDADLARQWGLRCKEGSSLQVQAVLRGSVAEAAGFSPADEWLAVEVPDGMPGASTAWRVGSVAEVAALLPLRAECRGKDHSNKGRKQHKIVAWVARDRRLLRLTMRLPAQAPPRWVLEPAAKPLAQKSAPTPRWPWDQGA